MVRQQRESKRNEKLQRFGAVILFVTNSVISSTVFAGAPNPFEGGPGPSVAPQGNQTSANIANNIATQNYGNTNNIQDIVPEVSGQGRDKKASGGQSQANLGSTMAAVAGAGMVAAAIPLLASISATQQAAGAALMAKAGIEFAQAIASAKTGAQNGQQDSMLRNNLDPVAASNPSNVVDAIAAQLRNNPDLQGVLAAKGVNAESFVQQLANGGLTDANGVRAAMGDNSPVAPEVAAQADQLANSAAGNIANANHPNGIQGENKVTTLENAKTEGGGNASGGAAYTSGAGGGGSAGSDSKPASSAAELLAQAMGTAAGKIPSREIASKESAAGTPGLSDSEKAMLEAMQASFPGALPANALAKVAAGGLDALHLFGISRPVGRYTVFQLAHRNFRSFRDWRTSKRKATARRIAKPAALIATKK